MKIKLLLFVILFITLHCSLSAQHQEIGEKPKIYKRQQRANLPDSLSIVYAFHKGTLQGNFRYYFMSTDNRSPLTDYYANAFGGGIKYETAPYKGFQFGLSGIYIFNILSSNLSKKDSLSNASNRYEIGLFDIENPDNKNNLAHLEEFYLKYNFKKNTIYLGKHLINTPFINLQDGRMRPTVVGGLWLELNLIKNTKIEMGWFNTIIPRSTTKWVSLENSVGLYSMGVNEDGTKSNYKNNLRTNGAGLIGISSNFGKNTKLQCWNIIFDNVFNASLVQLDYSKPLDKKLALIAAIQAIGEFAINNGGNSNPSDTYMQKHHKAFTFGAKLGLNINQLECTFNYNRITADGRYLMPREWGRDPFFTFMPRERNEGLGDVNAVNMSIKYNLPKQHLKSTFTLGYYHLPDVKNYKLNKYGIPSYTQMNLDIRYAFRNLLNGLEVQALYVQKFDVGNTYHEYKYIFNKVDMNLYNLVLNYYF